VLLLAKSFETTFIGAAGSSGGGGYVTTIAEVGGDLLGKGVQVDSNDNAIVTARGGAFPNYFSGILSVSPLGTLNSAKDVSQTTVVKTEPYDAPALDSSDNVFSVGRYNTASAFLTKLNSSGVMQWSRTLSGGSNNGLGVATATDSSDNVYLAGWVFTNGDEAILAKYNSSGTLQWQRYLGDTTAFPAEVDKFSDIVIDSSDNIYLTGESGANSLGFTDAFTAKYNSSGTLQWARVLGKNLNREEGVSVDVDSNGNVIMAGKNFENSTGVTSALTVKYNSSGVLQWTRIIEGARAERVAVDSLDNMYVTSGQAGAAASGTGCKLWKYNSSGTIQWQTTITSSTLGYMRFVGMAIDSLDNLILSSRYYDAPNNQTLVVKIPTANSTTGTYGPLTFTDDTFTELTSTLTEEASLMVSTTSSEANSTVSFTSTNNTGLTVNTTNI
tara:strand:- start:4681 stop:6006 length:1326 start_codon:yes stop_codon:yes gene_type:complete